MELKYNHIKIEKGKNKKWIDKQYFSKRDLSKKAYSIILPPPNITGKLHLGHAWDGFIQDTMIRYNKIDQKDVMWIPGMDHAGIATQAKVEERLKKENISRHKLGRESFLKKVWNWKEEYACIIRKQWGALGLALDYSKERFTMDKGLSNSVIDIFIKLYNDKLIYRGERAINWDPKLKTVLSNIEVINKDTSQKMYYIDYNLENGDILTIATVRTETLYSDVAIAINPNDKLNSHLIGKLVIHPLTNKKLPIIADSYIKVGKGTGIMKVSAHAEADFHILKNNNLPIIESIDKNGIMNSVAQEFEGMDRFEAREKIALKLKKLKKLSKVVESISAVGYSERSGEPIEILVQPQWFINMKPLAKKILLNMSIENKVNFYPHRFENVLISWMENIQDWCISRQLWWGHRIPAWYKDGKVKVQKNSPGDNWVQDEDVLDTWFSSSLAPFTFLELTNKNLDLKRFFPISLMVTGYDIIFFWIARMYFQSLEIMNEIPFNEVLIHGLIRDENGNKMSKSLGNGIDPMEVIEKYGSDSLRWFLLTNSTPGQDLRYSKDKIESAWGLNNKLWNISRYILEIMDDNENTLISDADIWITNKIIKLEKIIKNKIKTFEFTIIGKELTKFIQHDFSSCYIEFTKTYSNKVVAKRILRKLMLILHPFMPFITDHIYKLCDGDELLENTILNIKPLGEAKYIDEVIDVTNKIREFRVQNNLSNKEIIFYWIQNQLEELTIKMINKLSNSKLVENSDAKIPFGKNVLFIKLSDELKIQDNKRIKKQIKYLESEIKRAENMLSNKNFISKAPIKKINIEKNKLEKLVFELNEIVGKNV